jgi:NAD(P)-dependent dehydrogenase (short-subunit alcohol dehydrogenase family)
MIQRSILITGCSSGIGLASAREMRRRGWRVFATARKPEDIARLRDHEGVESLYLDYAEPDSISAAADQVLKATGGKLYALFNNGGYGQPGALEDIRPEVLRNVDLEGSAHKHVYKARIARMEAGGKQAFKLPPEAVAAKLVQAVESRKPKARYAVTLPTYAVALFRRLLPTAALDAIAKRN